MDRSQARHLELSRTLDLGRRNGYDSAEISDECGRLVGLDRIAPEPATHMQVPLRTYADESACDTLKTQRHYV